MPGAAVAVYARTNQVGVGERTAFRFGPLVVGQVRCDGSGRFQFNTPRDGSGPYQRFALAALAPGYGFGWVPFDPEAAELSADVSLEPEEVIHGHLFDLQGRPARGVAIELHGIYRSENVPLENIAFPTPLEQVPDAWPAPVRSDAAGRFVLHGLGLGMRARLVVDDPRFALQRIIVETGGPAGPSPFTGGALKAAGTSVAHPLTIALRPARVLTGRVTDAVTHDAISGVEIRPDLFSNVAARTDEDGQFRVRVPIGNQVGVSFTAPAGQPYLRAVQHLNWPKGAVEQSLDVALTSGAIIRGKVTVAGSGEGVDAAMVRFLPPRRSQLRDLSSISAPILTAADGSFELVANPGPGYLMAEAPTDDYVVREIDSRLVYEEDQVFGRRMKAHAYVAYDGKVASANRAVDIVLKRGVTVTGMALGVDGHRVQDARILSRSITSYRFARPWSGDLRDTVHDGHFALHWIDPDAEVSVYYLDPKGKRGASINVTGKMAQGGPLTVRLEHCGAAKARLVDPAGKPLSQYRFDRNFTMLMAADPPRGATQPDAPRMIADEHSLSDIDPTYQTPLQSDDQGRIMLPVLIPGATYRFTDRTMLPDPAGPRIRKEFTAKPGETLDLGDILIEKPRYRP